MLVDSAVSAVLQPSFAFLPRFGADINTISNNEVQLCPERTEFGNRGLRLPSRAPTGKHTSSKIELKMRLTMKAAILCFSRRAALTTALSVLLVAGFAQSSWAHSGTNPLNIFKNYFVTGDYVVAGWSKGSNANGYTSGTISIPDTLQPAQAGVPSTVPVGANIIAAYLYWATVEGNQNTYAGQSAYFNGYAVS